VITDIYAAPTIRITPVIKAESDPKKVLEDISVINADISWLRTIAVIVYKKTITATDTSIKNVI
jgi:hypothetical protein